MTQPNDLTREALLAGLAAQAGQLATAAEHLRESYRFSRQLKAILLIGLLLMCGIVAIAVLNLHNGSEIRSCTTPTGACYQRGQQSTSKAVASIVAQVNAHSDIVLLATLRCTDRRHPTTSLQACLRAHGVTGAPQQ